MAIASVVIPAHNEAATIGRSLTTLRRGGQDLDVVVVCNGCTDATAATARRADPRARVIEIPRPSKAEAVRIGNSATTIFPRVHLDADVELSGQSLLALVAPLGTDHGLLATAPTRAVPREGTSVWVRWFYDVWEDLPQVRSGLFGRGVVALSERAQDRVSGMPELMNDDLAMSEAFADHERTVVESAVVVVHPPRTVADLVRRRVRVATGNAQAAGTGVRRPGSRTTPGDLALVVRRRPAMAPKVAVYAAVHLLARHRARRAVRTGDFTTWLRDESSRS